GTKTLFVGNLSWSTRTEDLAEAFAPYGEVKSVRILTDRETGRSRGFAFVEVDEEAAPKAIEGLNGTNLGGRDLRV
ncbi:RNP-1 like RNA-binding protein, partial [Blyttiomyces helicus]